MIEPLPFPHSCNILDFTRIGPERILLTCAICHKTIAVIENFSTFKIKLTDKIYPVNDEAKYSEDTLKQYA